MNTDNIKRYCGRLRLSYIPNNIDQLIVDAQNGKPTYEGFLEMVMKEETKTREYKAYLNRLKQAKLPPRYDLDEYGFSHSTGVPRGRSKGKKTALIRILSAGPIDLGTVRIIYEPIVSLSYFSKLFKSKNINTVSSSGAGLTRNLKSHFW